MHILEVITMLGREGGDMLRDLLHHPRIGLRRHVAAAEILRQGDDPERDRHPCLDPRRRIDGVWMSDAELTATIARLLGMSYQERASNNCISVERADLVLAGCAILDAIRQAFPLPRLRVADRGLREGMLVEMMREDGALSGCR